MLTKADREKIKQASHGLLAAINQQLEETPDWTVNAATQADVKVLILDELYTRLPRPPFTEEETEALADDVYEFVWQKSAVAA